MQITLANGNVVQGTVAELQAAGLLTSTAARIAANLPVNKHRPGTQAHRIAQIILKAKTSGKPQQLPVTIDSELTARKQISQVSGGLGIKVASTKIRNGHRVALAISIA